MFSDNNESPSPQDQNRSLFQRAYYFLFDYSFELIKLNFLFILACVPIITFPAAISGLTWVTSRMIRKKEFSVLKDFWRGFRSDFGKSLVCGLIFTIIYYLIGVSILYYLNVMQSSWFGLVLLVIFALLIAIPVMMSVYCFSLIATVQLPLFGIIKNAFLLSFINIKNNMISLLFFVITAALILRFYPFSLLAFVLPIIPILRLVDLYFQLPVIEKYVAAKNS